MREESRRPRLALFAAAAVLAGVLAAAGSALGAGGGVAPASVIAAAQRKIEAARKPLVFTPPGPPIKAAQLKGKDILVISVDQRIPALAEVARATQQAGRVVGVKVGIFDAKSDVSRMQQGIQQAIRQSDAMILLGIPIAIVPGPLEQAAKAKVPAVSVLNNEPLKGKPGQGAGKNVYASTAPSYFRGGELVAAKAIVDSKAQANVVIFTTSEITPAAAVVNGMRTMLRKCSACKVRQNDTPLAEWATKLSPKASAEVRRDPNVDYLLPIFDGMGIFVTAGVEQSGAKGVRVAAFNATPAALQLIQNGGTFTADPGQPNGWTGWGALDQAMRGMLGLKPGNPAIPIRYFDKENLHGVNVKNEGALFGNPDYQGGFKKLWGVR